MNKKIIVIVCIIAIGCAANALKAGASEEPGRIELALITDIGTIDDGSFNQGSWEGLVQYAREKNISHKYYQPAEQSDDAYLRAIDLAVRDGAKIVVTPGFLFDVPVFIAQDRYPEVYFILVDGTPFDGDWYNGPVFRTGQNTVGILYAEDQAGFLAGYAAVKDGYRKLGFMGGMAVPAVVRYGCGFVQGVEYAAQELGLVAGSVTVNYHYTGGFSATPVVQALAASWYNSDVDVIFACGGAVCYSVIAAAEQTGKKVIGVDVDQSGDSPAFITSAMKMLRTSVYTCIAAYYDGNFPGGRDIVLSAADGGVGLPMNTSRFRSFNQADYDTIYKKLASGSIPRISDLEAWGSPWVVPVRITRIIEIL